MSLNHILGASMDLRGKAREKWGRLTNDAASVTHGQQEQQVGAIRRRYSTGAEQRRAELREFDAVTAEIWRTMSRQAAGKGRAFAPINFSGSDWAA